ncbi:MAG TPA: LacI family DNA-binding transcriptional regulator [Rubrobacter sp.]|nr:LacI family DNA-binding transcriptional regulator [Rubrobacter sp.]
MRDVASKAGVSFQTAGKVLNGKGSVSSETRERILDAAKSLGYVPNALARSLVTRSTCTIGIVASDLSDAELARFVVGAEREARRQGHGVLIGSIDRDGSDAERYLRMLLERRVDGILTAAPQMERDARIGELLRGLVPAVSIHRIPGGGVPLVGSDHVETALLATRHLLGLGHRRIATVTGSAGRQVTAMRLKGYERALEEAEVSYDPALVESGDWEADGAYEATLRLLDQAPDITAFYAQNDTMAFGVMSALHERGLGVPEDCAVVGCDDIPMAAHAIPPLTTVHVPFYETGETAVRLLLDVIAGRGDRPKRILLPVRLVRRGSCGAGVGATDKLSAREE